MRLQRILIPVGVVLVVSGIAWAVYYATVVFPPEATRITSQCLPGMLCSPLTPVWWRPLFILGEGIAVLGLVSLIVGLLLRAMARSRLTGQHRS